MIAEEAKPQQRQFWDKKTITLCIGLVAGGLGGALGLGGGFLIVPALTSLVGLEPRNSIGTSAVVVLMVSCVACQAYLARGVAQPTSALIISLSALLTARVGAVVTAKVNPKTLKKLFGGWLMIVSVLIGIKTLGLLKASTTLVTAGSSAFIPGLLVLGAATGFISGLLGVGGGTVLVPVLSLVFGFQQAVAQGCALLAMILPAFMSARTHWKRGNVEKKLILPAIAGAMVGAAIGSSVAGSLPEKSLKILCAVVLALVGVRYVGS